MTNKKSQLTVFLLCLFFGFSGAHRFYTGYVWLGVLYILTGGILGIGIIVDLLFILFGGYEDVDGNALT
jgi:TM2 domain-containing membrane protein YozV